MQFFTRCLTFLILSGVVFNDSCDARPSKPNIVFILVDDLGYMDISPNNPDSFYETPNLQKLAEQGMRFTNGYAANPVCSPTRYSILTGKYPTRVRATNWFSGNRTGRYAGAPLNDWMPLEEITLAEAVKAQGYQTAFIGKWHLGTEEKFWPENQGFDINMGGHHRGSPPGGYFSPYKNPRLQDGPPGEHLTARLTTEALNLLEQMQDQPFLLYLAFYTVHTPLQAPPGLVKKYEAKRAQQSTGTDFATEEQVWPDAKERLVRIRQNHPIYAAMVETMDTSVGRILQKLEELHLDDNTIICFTADNGGLSTSEGSPTSNLPLRGGKGWIYEGGIREPYLIKWPGVTNSGSTCDTPVCSIDFYPTICHAAGIPKSALPEIDGADLTPLLKNSAADWDRPLFWHYPHYSNQGGFPGGAIRDKEWKLVERYEDGRCHLFNLKTDVGEQQDLSAVEPELTRRLREQLHDWYKLVDAQFLTANKQEIMPWRP